MIEWIPVVDGGAVERVDATTMTLYTSRGAVRADLINIIPPQAPAQLAAESGLASEHGWCPIDPDGFESALVPNVHVIGDACIAARCRRRLPLRMRRRSAARAPSCALWAGARSRKNRWKACATACWPPTGHCRFMRGSRSRTACSNGSRRGAGRCRRRCQRGARFRVIRAEAQNAARWYADIVVIRSAMSSARAEQSARRSGALMRLVHFAPAGAGTLDVVVRAVEEILERCSAGKAITCTIVGIDPIDGTIRENSRADRNADGIQIAELALHGLQRHDRLPDPAFRGGAVAAPRSWCPPRRRPRRPRTRRPRKTSRCMGSFCHACGRCCSEPARAPGLVGRVGLFAY